MRVLLVVKSESKRRRQSLPPDRSEIAARMENFTDGRQSRRSISGARLAPRPLRSLDVDPCFSSAGGWVLAGIPAEGRRACNGIDYLRSRIAAEAKSVASLGFSFALIAFTL